MNLLLLDPFEVAKEYPETLTGSLKFGHSTIVKFNEKGDYLASGLRDGTICVFDNDTNQVIAILQRHKSTVHSIHWSKCGGYILSSSLDGNVLLWDLKTQSVVREIIFNSAVWSAQLHPDTIDKFICTVYDEAPVCVDWEDPDNMKIFRLPMTPLSEEYTNSGSKKDKINALCVYYAFSMILMCTNKGWINVIRQVAEHQYVTVYSQKICGSILKQITVCESSFKAFVNCSDRVIRQLTVSKDALQAVLEKNTDEVADLFEVEQKYQDVVNRLQWNSINTNHNGEYLIASTYGSGAHDVYMWETTMGSLIKVLEGPKEELLDIDWNNKRCTIVANGLDSGYIYLWSNLVPQKWSALAPDFVEIEENIEYEEREDEFDILPDDELNKRQLNQEDEQIDIITRDEVDARGLKEQQSFIIPIDLSKEIDPRIDEDDD